MEFELKKPASDAEGEGVRQEDNEQKEDNKKESSAGHGVLGLGALVLFGASLSTCSTVNDIESQQGGLFYQVKDIKDKLDPVNGEIGKVIKDIKTQLDPVEVEIGKAINYWLQASPEKREKRDNEVMEKVRSGTIGLKEYAWIKATTEIRDRLQRFGEVVTEGK